VVGVYEEDEMDLVPVISGFDQYNKNYNFEAIRK